MTRIAALLTLTGRDPHRRGIRTHGEEVAAYAVGLAEALGLLVALFAAGVAAGCGGGEEEPLSKGQYIKQGDAACKESTDRIAEAADEDFADLGPDEMPTEKQLTQFVEETLKPEIEGQLSDLRDLQPPDADGDELDGIYEGVDEALAKVEDDPGLLLQRGKDPFEEANEAITDYGFKQCGQS